MKLETPRQVIEVLGGLEAVAALTGRKYGTVSAWQTRIGTFPASTYVVMTDELRRLGYAAPDALWGQTGRPDESENCEAANA